MPERRSRKRPSLTLVDLARVLAAAQHAYWPVRSAIKNHRCPNCRCTAIDPDLLRSIHDLMRELLI